MSGYEIAQQALEIRARMETLLNELKLRSPDGTAPVANKA